MGRYFGTDGIRGTFGDALVNPDFAFRVGCALGRHLAQENTAAPPVAVIGRDTRVSGPALSEALVAGLNRHEVYVHDAGIVPTPAIAQVLRERHAALGIAVTASHNPAGDNGIKLFDARGCKLDAEVEALVERYIDETDPGEAPGGPARCFLLDGAAHYINYMRSLMHQGCLKDWKIVLDLANGATCETTPAVFRRWGAQLFTLGDNPDGENINLGVGSEYPERLGDEVRRCGAALGIAHDGDGDRLVVCDERGEVVDGDILLGLYGLYALRGSALRGNVLVATVQSNLGLDHALRAEGGRVDRVAVGDRNVARRMRELDTNLGGESSGHFIFSDFSPTGDGLLAAIKTIELMVKTGKPLSVLREEVPLFPQETLNLRVAEKKPLEETHRLSAAIDKVAADLGDAGRVLVRYSGTEPKLRMLVEGRDARTAAKMIKRLEKAARRDLGVIGR